MSRLIPSRPTRARTVVLAGLVAVAAGVYLLVGLPWALVVGGAAAVLFGLVVMDVDPPTEPDGGPRGKPPA